MARQAQVRKARPRPRGCAPGVYRCPTCTTTITLLVPAIGMSCGHADADSRKPAVMVRVGR